jgi:hypothetical protein
MMKIDKSYFLNQIDQFLKENDPLIRYQVTIDYHSAETFSIDAENEEEAKGYALDSFHDEFNMDDVDITNITVLEESDVAREGVFPRVAKAGEDPA